MHVVWACGSAFREDLTRWEGEKATSFPFPSEPPYTVAADYLLDFAGWNSSPCDEVSVFGDYPESRAVREADEYMVKVEIDDGLYTVADRQGWGSKLFDGRAIARERLIWTIESGEETLVAAAETVKSQKYDMWEGPVPEQYDPQKELIVNAAQRYQEQQKWVEALGRRREARERLWRWPPILALRLCSCKGYV